MSNDSPQGRFPRAVSELEVDPQIYESITNEQLKEIYQAVHGLQKMLVHEEFHFVRYLLKMVLVELEEQGGSDETPPVSSDAK